MTCQKTFSQANTLKTQEVQDFNGIISQQIGGVLEKDVNTARKRKTEDDINDRRKKS